MTTQLIKIQFRLGPERTDLFGKTRKKNLMYTSIIGGNTTSFHMKPAKAERIKEFKQTRAINRPHGECLEPQKLITSYQDSTVHESI